MKILLVLGKYLPEKNGGIENYSHWLATLLLQNSHQVNAAILYSVDMEPYNYAGVQVFPLKNGFDSFSEILREQHYDICHFQEYSGFNGIDLSWFKEARKHCEKIFFTFHLPYLTCYKGDFRFNGVEDCNNFSNPERCIKCISATKLNYKRSRRFNFYNAGINLLIPILKKTQKLKNLKIRIQKRKDDLKELLNTCDDVFLIADWFKEILETNGYNSPVLKKIPPITKISAPKIKGIETGLKKKVVFAGRIEKEKGLHLLCRAMNLISAKDIQLDVFGNIVDESYFKNCEHEYAFNYKGSVPREELLELLREYDFLILPSVFTEMYPMILQEAIYEQLPVIASAAKGNKGIVHEGKNGFIFNYDDYRDLDKVIDRAYILKRSGWQPEFTIPGSAEKNIFEIISYYNEDQSILRKV